MPTEHSAVEGRLSVLCSKGGGNLAQSAVETRDPQEGRAPHNVLRLLVAALSHQGCCNCQIPTERSAVERRLPVLRSKGGGLLSAGFRGDDGAREGRAPRLVPRLLVAALRQQRLNNIHSIIGRRDVEYRRPILRREGR